MKFQKSELILNADDIIYRLNLLPEDISDTIITVVDPERYRTFPDILTILRGKGNSIRILEL